MNSHVIQKAKTLHSLINGTSHLQKALTRVAWNRQILPQRRAFEFCCHQEMIASTFSRVASLILALAGSDLKGVPSSNNFLAVSD
jgi:hypothetical protein